MHGDNKKLLSQTKMLYHLWKENAMGQSMNWIDFLVGSGLQQELVF